MTRRVTTERGSWHDLKNAKDAFYDSHNYISRHRILLSSDLFGLFQKIDDIMWEAIVQREYGQEGDDQSMWLEADKKIRDETKPIRDEIERLTQKRLHYHEAE